MRIFLGLFMLALLANAEMKYVVQVLSVKDKKAITPEFMAKLNQVKMPHQIKYMNREYKVFMGEFQTDEEAVSHLSEIQKKVNQDAFVTTIEVRTGLKAEAKMQQMMVLAQAKLLQASKQEEPENTPDKPLKTEGEKSDTIDVPGPEDKLVIKKTQTKKIVPMKDEGKTEEIFCKPSKRALREAEISEALSFYKNSSFYTFDQGH